MTEQKLNKWQKELGQLDNKAFKKATSELENAYQYGFASLMHDLKQWVDDYDTMTTSQQREFDRRMAVASALSDVVDKIGSDVDGTVSDYVRGAGEHGYQGTLYSLEMQHNVELADTIIDPNYLEQLVNQPVGPDKFSKTMYERLNIDRKKLASRTEQAIMDGLWRGEGYDKIAGRISELSGASYNAAKRIARTEGGRVQSQTTQQAYQDANDQGVDIKKRWLATLDGKTRADHRVLDGQTVGLDEMFHVDGFKAMAPHLFGAASEDINCRCTTIPIVGDIEPELRRNNETGRQIKYRSYDDWVNGKRIKKQTEDDSVKIDLKDKFDKTNMKKAVGEANYNDFINHVSNISEKQAQLYDKYAEKFDYFQIKHGSGSYWSPFYKRLQLNQKDFNGHEFAKKFETVYHEQGHTIDDLAYQLLRGNPEYIKVPGKRKMQVLRSMSADPKYGLNDAIKGDLWKYVHGDLPMKSPRKPSFGSKNYDAKMKTYVAYEDTKRQNVRDFKEEMKELDTSVYATISDIMDGTGWFGSYPLGYGHGTTYWKEFGHAEMEFFAELSAAINSNPELHKLMKDMFPNAVKAYDTIIDDILKG